MRVFVNSANVNQQKSFMLLLDQNYSKNKNYYNLKLFSIIYNLKA